MREQPPAPPPRDRNSSRRRLSLPAKILLLSLCNLLLLGAAALVFVRLQLGSGSESVLLGPASDKMLGLVLRLTPELDRRPEAEWDQVLAQLGQEYRARVYLTDSLGYRIAGAPELLPGAVRARFRPGAPPGSAPPWLDLSNGGKRPPPPPRREGEGERKRGHIDRPPPPVFLVVTENRYWVGGRLRVPREPGGGMLVLETASIFNPALFLDPVLIGSVGLAVAGLSFVCWFWFVRGLTRSIRHMDEATERIAEGSFDAQVVVKRGDELGHLGEQINRMAGRLETLVSGQKRFLGDIAHELSAPVARMQMALGILEERADEEGRASLADLREEVEHISSLVNELLHFSKAALRPGLVKVEPLSVAEVVRRVVAREGGGGQPSRSGPRIHVAVDADLHVLANEVYFARSLANLLRNSIRYAGHAGPVEIAARPEAEEVVITVADAGPGVAEDELDRILEPFYRPERARTRATGGAGLGLAIVKAGIESCHGSVVCRNREPHGLEVTIRLPAVSSV